MRVLVACEESGKVRDAFRRKGHDAWSCDLQDSRKSEYSWAHLKCDVTTLLNDQWDMIIAFPPCTDICVSGARWFPEKIKDGRQKAGIDFFMSMINARADKIAVENPIGIMSRLYRKPDQIIQPWWFGHGETKATCLWLKGLPKLNPTNIVLGREQRIFRMGPSSDRSRERSKTFDGIANAMAEQWGNLKKIS